MDEDTSQSGWWGLEVWMQHFKTGFGLLTLWRSKVVVATSDFELGIIDSLNVTKRNYIYIIKVGGLNLSLWVEISKNEKKKIWQRYLSLQINYRKEK